MKLSHRFGVVRVLRDTRDAATFLADDHLLDKKNVIVKVVTRQSLREKCDVERYLTCFRELQHPKIAPLLDAGYTKTGDAFTVREAFDTFSPQIKTDIVSDLLSAVQFLHSSGLVHGNIKPQNLLSTRDRCLLVDPGSYLIRPASSADVQFGAPELDGGARPDRESDYYSVGAVLYSLYSGHAPFDDTDPAALKHKRECAVPAPLADIANVPYAVSDSIDALLRKNREERRSGFSKLLDQFEVKLVRAERVPLIGREREINKICEWVEVKAASLRVLHLIGPAGIGKTRVIDHVSALQGFKRHAFMHISSLDIGSPIYDKLEKQLRAISSGDAVLSSGSSERRASDFVTLLSRVSKRMHLTIVIEDLQWADSEVAYLIRQICCRASDIPARLIVTTRSEYQAVSIIGCIRELLGGYETMHLSGLSERHSAELINRMRDPGSPQSSPLPKALGNPMCLIESVRCHETKAEDNSRFEIGLERSLSTIPGEILMLLGVLAASDRPLLVSQLQAIANTGDSFPDALGKLLATGLVHEGDQKIWVATLSIKSAVYSLLSTPKRKRIHELLFKHTAEDSGTRETLAVHAYASGAWREAVRLHLELGRQAYAERLFAKALSHYEFAQKAAGRAHAPLGNSDLLDVASCYGHTGQQPIARKICEAIIRTTREPKSDVRALAYQLLSTLDLKRLRPDYLQQAVEALPERSPRRRILYAHLATSFIFQGDLTNGQRLLDQLSLSDEALGEHDAYNFAMIRALLHYSRGEFQEASQLLNDIAPGSDLANASRLNYMALCSEALGDLRGASMHQMHALKLIIKSGDLVAESSCLQNLAVFATKLGLHDKAQSYFMRAREVLEAIRQDAMGDVTGRASFLADEACFNFAVGDYSAVDKAFKHMMPRRGDLMETERLHCLLTACSLRLALDDKKSALECLELIDESPLASFPYFLAERLVLKSALSERPEIQELQKSLDLSRKLGAAHQECRILIRLAESNSRGGQMEEANKRLENALQLAKTNRYRPLLAEIMMLKAKVAKHPKEKEIYLLRCYKLAEQCRIAELTAHASASLGKLLLSGGHHGAASEYLHHSTLATAQLAEQLPARLRTRYLDKDWRVEAREELRKCSEHRFLGFGKPRSLAQSDPLFFRLLYSANMAGATASTTDSFLISLRSILETIPRRAGAIVAIKDGATTWQQVRLDLDDNLKKRVIALAQRDIHKPYFDHDRALRNRPMAWLPFQSQSYRGGIYLYCTQRGSPLGETEIEFLTILQTVASSALEQIQHRATRVRTMPAVGRKHEFHGIVGASDSIQAVYSHIEMAAGSSATVLIEGETGTGKELVAKAIHKLGSRAKGPFIPVDCGAIPEGLIESELFGAVRGAYTGATSDRAGLFETANGGTLFLDEISNTSAAVQAKLLRVLQEREVRRVGDHRMRSIDVRLIAACNRNLRELADAGNFRQDLLYRLNVLHIILPPLRERRDDVPLLADHFLQQLNSRHGVKKRFGSDAFDSLLVYSFPGNVRELQNMVERAFFASRGSTVTIAPADSVTSRVSEAAEVQTYFKDLTEGRASFWTSVHDRYKRRDISREKVVALVDLGLRKTAGSYKDLAVLFRMKENEYRKLMDFLRRNNCLLDFRPYRKPPQP